jgi:hypothetical protein
MKGSSLASQFQLDPNPHPNPLPAYQERGPEKKMIRLLCYAPGGASTPPSMITASTLVTEAAT